jgi:hypothetical protein
MTTRRHQAAIAGALLGAVAFLSSCGERRDEPKEADTPPVDLVLVRQMGKTHQQYVDALLLCGSARALDWEEARRQLELVQPYHVFDEDPDLIRRFRAGDSAARSELGRRGLILNALMAFPKGYDRRKWDDARKILVEAGQPGQILLSTTLIEILMNGQFREMWDPARMTLVEVGPVALETVIGWARELVARTPADTAIFRIEDLAGAGVALISFGEKGLVVLDEFAKSPKRNVRRACARAIGDAVLTGEANAIRGALTCAPILVRMVSEDADWTVRTASAEALGRMSGAKALAGRTLCDRMKKERDRVVLKAIIESIGELKYEESVPDLMIMIEVPVAETVNLVMNALYHVTGERLTRKEQWLQWYATQYPRWKVRPR